MVIKRNAKQASGFTLVEVLVVMAILGLLSSIAIISVTGAQRTARVGACKTEFAAAQAALSAYSNDTNTTSGATISVLISGGYLESLSGTEGYTISVNNSVVSVTVGSTSYSNADGCLNIT